MRVRLYSITTIECIAIPLARLIEMLRIELFSVNIVDSLLAIFILFALVDISLSYSRSSAACVENRRICITR